MKCGINLGHLIIGAPECNEKKTDRQSASSSSQEDNGSVFSDELKEEAMELKLGKKLFLRRKSSKFHFLFLFSKVTEEVEGYRKLCYTRSDHRSRLLYCWYMLILSCSD